MEFRYYGKPAILRKLPTKKNHHYFPQRVINFSPEASPNVWSYMGHMKFDIPAVRELVWKKIRLGFGPTVMYKGEYGQ